MGSTQSAKQAKKGWRLLAILAVVGALAGGFVNFGPPHLFAKSAEPDFCAGCHVMQSEYENWFYSAHRNFKCVECHLPNTSFPRHATWKGIEGMRDVFFFYTGQVPETIRLSEHGQSTLVENCRRCHEEMVSRINEDRQCWSCHRRVSHQSTGTM
jgi:cytochrome c nitrite reductase small subunit